MPRFLLIFRGGAVVNATIPPVDRHAQIERWAAWTRELQSAGHHVPGGVPLGTDGTRIAGAKRNATPGAPADKDLVTGTYFVAADSTSTGCTLTTR
jgi:hypothetical protein